ncbi:hypothetical protein MVEN_02340900 [Mycena venus]|uniref:Uncharacterized protein n=1 Tax=Mycena venus TaxID=2733690 RepID=A0A8H6X3L6_9AGAR|nr:hypothetical protein MVEN_02340900 [Mycena venus]
MPPSPSSSSSPPMSPRAIDDLLTLFQQLTPSKNFSPDSRSSFASNATSASCLAAFSEFIGYKPATEEAVAHYDCFAAPILYDKREGRVDLEHVFRGPILLKVFVSLIRGPNGAIGLFEGKSKRPQANCLEHIHKITCITPGAICIVTIVAVWLFSADTQLGSSSLTAMGRAPSMHLAISSPLTMTTLTTSLTKRPR